MTWDTSEDKLISDVGLLFFDIQVVPGVSSDYAQAAIKMVRDFDKVKKEMSYEDTREELEHAATVMLTALDPSPTREGLKDTPKRFAKAWAEWCDGYDKDPASLLTQFNDDGPVAYDEMVFQGCIPFFSFCEHHLIPFFGYAHVAYIPKGRVVGLSKLARVVDAYARRLSIQERITSQVCDLLFTELDALGVGVTLQARHLCMESRGVKKIGTFTVTTALRGVMKTKDSAKAEFMSLVQTAMAGVVKI